MWCDPPSIPAAQSWSSLLNFPYSLSPTPASFVDPTANKLSFVYQPGVGLYDKKKLDQDQDLRVTAADVDERIRIDGSNHDIDHRWSSSLPIKSENLYKTCLRRQNEQDSLPIRPKSLSTTTTRKFLPDEQKFITSDISKKSLSNTTTTHYHQHHHVHHVQLFNINQSQIHLTSSSIDLLKQTTPTKSSESNSKRKLNPDNEIFNPSPCYEKRRRPPVISPPKVNLFPDRKTTPLNSIKQEMVETKFLSNKCEKNLLDEELNRQKAKLFSIEEQQRKIKTSVMIKKKFSLKKPFSAAASSSEQTTTPVVKKIRSTDETKTKPSEDIPIVKKPSPPPEIVVPSQGLLLCPKVEPPPTMKKKKKKKIVTTVAENTSSLDDDLVLDSILFDDMQANQQQWQQWMILTMEKELHLESNSSDSRKKTNCKLTTTCSTSSDLPPLPLGPQPIPNRFLRTSEFLATYEKLFNFDGMRHWYPNAQ